MKNSVTQADLESSKLYRVFESVERQAIEDLNLTKFILSARNACSKAQKILSGK